VATIVESILARSYAFVVVSLRYLIVGGWAAAVVLAIMFLPPLSATSSGGLSNLIPPGSAAARARSRSLRSCLRLRLFSVPSRRAGICCVRCRRRNAWT
jgi:hypothetical protein